MAGVSASIVICWHFGKIYLGNKNKVMDDLLIKERMDRPEKKQE
jgi:hypothetical protein